VQQAARVSLYDAMMLSRVALHTVVVLAVFAMLLFMRQLRRSDRQQAQQQRRLERQIGARTAELRELAGHLVNAREDERSRVARELHDEMGGLFTAMKLEFTRLRCVPDLPPAVRDRVCGVEARLNDGIVLKRRIVENLRPSSLEQLGLCAALSSLCEDTAANLGIDVIKQLEPVPLDKDAELTVYRLVQESLTNISKYATAQRISVTLEQQGARVQVTVQDDGRGFDVATVRAGHHGLLGMRVRVEAHAGTLTIESAPGRGTLIRASLPVSGAPGGALN
jgi:signal transduction histidine kinase